IDQILYNVPGRTVVDMQNETVLRLADVPNIVGIKDATGDIARGSELIKSLNGKMPVYSGDDETAYKLILAGAKGNISVTANVLPAEMSQLCRLALDGKAEQAQTLNDQLASVHEAMFVEANPIPVKFALNRMGLIGSGIRLPLTELSKQYHSQVESALTAKKLI
ncbi:dihydrodipicolinate synthase family protein, partial [Oleiphilus sp. HI0128]